MARLHLMAILGTGLAVWEPCGNAQAASPTFQVGDVVECDGNMTGTIVRTQPRPGWDEPFYIVYSEGSTTTNEIKCLPRTMRNIGAGAGQPGGQASARTQATPPPTRLRIADTPVARQTAGGAVPDGLYRCHKISPGGQLMDIGTLVMGGGRGTLEGMPNGWTVRSISMLKTSPLLVAFDYTSASGWHDRLDCVPQ